ncbi:MAG: GntR family transcriptional regulator [Desulfobacterales bacterium]|nr:GntR family transcriptional regulator [Anaerolineae bacterium]MCG2772751.1 GntR family transcriptional regulator [Desulfobacterales bacterium]
MSTELLLQTLEHSSFAKDSAIPLYQQLKELILEALAQGILQPSDRLPSERQLSELMGISRLTVRHALNDLTNAGWLVPKTGKGTYVQAPKLEQGIHQLMGLTEDMRRRGHIVSSRTVQATGVPASAGLAIEMNLKPGEELVLLERLRIVDGIPLGLERSYLVHKLCPGILEYDLEKDSLYRILRSAYGLRPDRAEQTYEAALAGRREAQLLGIVEGAAILFLERTVFLDTGEIIEHGCAWYCGNRYKFHAVLRDTASMSDQIHTMVS